MSVVVVERKSVAVVVDRLRLNHLVIAPPVSVVVVVEGESVAVVVVRYLQREVALMVQLEVVVVVRVLVSVGHQEVASRRRSRYRSRAHRKPDGIKGHATDLLEVVPTSRSGRFSGSPQFPRGRRCTRKAAVRRVPCVAPRVP